MIECRTCGVPVLNGQVHIDYHLNRGDYDNVSTTVICPLDGAGITLSYGRSDGSGHTQFLCGHLVRWPRTETDEDRHGPWSKVYEKYEDGCRYDQPH